MKIINDPKYKAFFISLQYELLIKPNSVKIDNNIVYIFENITLSFKGNQKLKVLEIPPIINVLGPTRSNQTLNIEHANCEKIIFNSIYIHSILMNECDFEDLEFKDLKNSAVSTFYFDGKNKEQRISKIKQIPKNIGKCSIHIIKSNNKWDILDNKTLNNLIIKKAKIVKINNYPKLIKMSLYDAIDIFDINFSELKSIKHIDITNTTKSIISNENAVKITHLGDLIELNLNDYISGDKIILEELPNLETLNIICQNTKIKENNYLVLNKINSKKINELKISGYRLEDSSILYSPKINILDIEKDLHPDIIHSSSFFVNKKLKIMILSKDKSFNCFINNYKTNIYEYILQNKRRIRKDFNSNIDCFLYLRKSTLLMGKLLKNQLDKITDDDFKFINDTDRYDVNLIHYCITLDSLKKIIKHKDYTMNNIDYQFLQGELKSYYEKIWLSKQNNFNNKGAEKLNKLEHNLL